MLYAYNLDPGFMSSVDGMLNSDPGFGFLLGDNRQVSC